MADYIHFCPSCRTFYPSGVAQAVRKGVCTCGTSLQITNIPASEFVNLTHDEAVRRLSSELDRLGHPPKSTPAVQHRKRQPPEEYDVDPRQLPTSGCLAYFAALAVPVAAVFSFAASEFDLRYLFGGLCLALFLFTVARICAHLAHIVRHLGAIRWLMQHGDETEPVPAPQPQPETNNSNTGLWVAAGIMLVLIVFLAIYLGTSPT